MTKIPLKKLGMKPGAARRRAVGGSPQELVRGAALGDDRPIPWVLRPATAGVGLTQWASSAVADVERLLLEHRALLFRGFDIADVDAFHAFVMATSNGELLEYRDRTTPRTTEGDRIYTATVHPADQRIHLHNEGTYWVRWAQKLYFCCLKAPAEGGQTPIADVRRVYQRIDPEIRERFADKQWSLVRNFNDGFGLTWQEVFQTESRQEVEDYCRDNAIELQWKDGDRLRTRQTRPAVRTHPATGEKVWFNHAIFYHHTTLDAATRDALLREFGADGLPYCTTYGDGSPIEDDVAAHVRAAYEAEKIVFDWQPGDVMLLDNMSFAHAREPFVGERLVVVAMTDVLEGESLAS